jgi:serine beta-lactamase-like protein LACTB, mitochondrial
MMPRSPSVRIPLTALCLLATAAVAQQQTRRSAIDSTVVAAVRKHVVDTMDQYNIPAVSIIVQLADARWAEAYGDTDVENAVRATGNSVYRLASVSKVFTATAVMQLVERGRIELDAPIQRYVKEYPEKAHVVTVRQLLTHTSGVRHYKSDDDDADPEVNNTRRYSTLTEAINQFSQDPLEQQPGTKLLYSTHGLRCSAELSKSPEE